MRYWYVPGAGLSAREESPGENAVEIPAATYHTCIENYELYDLGYKDGLFFASINVEAYRLAALDKLKNPNYIVHNGIQYFDDEVFYLHESYYTRSGQRCALTQPQMVTLVTERNRRYAQQRKNIESAECAEEIDAYMRA